MANYIRNIKRRIGHLGGDRKKKLIILLAAVVVIVAGIFLIRMNHTYRSYKVVDEIDQDASYQYQYIPFGDYLLKYSSDGAAYFNKKGEVWNTSYNIRTPIAAVCGSYAVIAEQNGNKIYLFDQNKLVKSMETSYPIIKVQVSKQGIVAAVLEEDDASYIYMYNKEGNEMVSMKSVLYKNGYPLSMSISEDAQKMAVSYANIDGTQTKSSVIFYDFSENGKTKENNIAGGFNQYDSMLVPEVAFLNNDTCVAFGSHMVTIYNVGNKPSIQKEFKITGEIQKVFHDNQNLGMIVKTEKEDQPYQALVYSANGKKQMDYTYADNYKNVALDGKTLLMYDSQDCQVVNFSGKKKFQYKFDETVQNMFPAGKQFQYFYITSTKVQKIKLAK